MEQGTVYNKDMTPFHQPFAAVMEQQGDLPKGQKTKVDALFSDQTIDPESKRGEPQLAHIGTTQMSALFLVLLPLRFAKCYFYQEILSAGKGENNQT